MSQVIVNFIGVIEGGLKSFFIDLSIDFLAIDDLLPVILTVSFLQKHFGAEFLQEFVCLRKKFFDFVVLFELHKFEVGLHVLLLEGVESFLGFLVLDHLLLFLFDIVDAASLVRQFFAIFMLFTVPLKELFLVDAQVLHELFVFDLLAAFVVAFDLVLKFFHAIALIAVFLKFFPAEVGAIEELLLEESDRVIIIFKAL